MSRVLPLAVAAAILAVATSFLLAAGVPSSHRDVFACAGPEEGPGPVWCNPH
jgi:hypothetical protein